MDLQRSIVDDDTGVSPVIGVILMVAVTVIIAAVIGSTALGLGDSVSETPPQVSFDIEQIDNDELKDGYDNTRVFGPSVVITHSGGDDVERENIRVEVNGKPAYAVEEEPGKASTWHIALGVVVPWYDQETISSGDETKILTGTDAFDDRIIDPADEKEIRWRTYDDGEAVYAGEDNNLWTEDEVGLPLEKGDTVRIVWESGDQSQTLLEEEIR